MRPPIERDDEFPDRIFSLLPSLSLQLFPNQGVMSRLKHPQPAVARGER